MRPAIRRSHLDGKKSFSPISSSTAMAHQEQGTPSSTTSHSTSGEKSYLTPLETGVKPTSPPSSATRSILYPGCFVFRHDSRSALVSSLMCGIGLRSRGTNGLEDRFKNCSWAWWAPRHCAIHWDHLANPASAGVTFSEDAAARATIAYSADQFRFGHGIICAAECFFHVDG